MSDDDRPSVWQDLATGALIGTVGRISLGLLLVNPSAAVDYGLMRFLLQSAGWGLVAGTVGGVGASLTRLLEARVALPSWLIVLCAGVSGGALGGVVGIAVVYLMALPDGFRGPVEQALSLFAITASAITSSLVSMLVLRLRYLLDALRDRPTGGRR